MDIEFGTPELVAYYQCTYSGKQPFSEIILRGYRKVVTKMYEAKHIVELSNFRALNIEKIGNQWSARINDQFRLEFNFVKPNTIYLLIISKHYE